MRTDKNTVRYIANLAKLKFTEEELDKFSADFGKILEYFRNICAEDLVEFNSSPEPGQQAVFREDKVEKSENREELLQNAKQVREGFIVVPKVLE